MLHNYDVRTHTVTLELIEKKFDIKFPPEMVDFYL